MAALLLRVNAQWIGKHTLFRFPFAGMMKFLGGIPVNRERSNNLVNTYVHQFAIAHNEFRLAIAPEGTRKQVTRWKTGFYHIAVIAQVPIVLGFIDYKTKRCGIAGIFYPTGDIDIDIASIQSYYASFRGRR
jgi:1-acyl-sn-glycerol-3-phosphate acyltransferase